METGRRRRWSEDDKLRIVLESLQCPWLVSATARRHGILRSLLLIWRRAFEARRLTPTMVPEPAFVPAVVSEPEPASKPSARTGMTASSGRMVIVLGRGRRVVVVDAGVDADALARVLDVLDRR